MKKVARTAKGSTNNAPAKPKKVEVAHVGKMNQFKSLDDIPDMDDAWGAQAPSWSDQPSSGGGVSSHRPPQHYQPQQQQQQQQQYHQPPQHYQSQQNAVTYSVSTAPANYQQQQPGYQDSPLNSPAHQDNHSHIREQGKTKSSPNFNGEDYKISSNSYDDYKQYERNAISRNGSRGGGGSQMQYGDDNDEDDEDDGEDYDRYNYADDADDYYANDGNYRDDSGYGNEVQFDKRSSQHQHSAVPKGNNGPQQQAKNTSSSSVSNSIVIGKNRSSAAAGGGSGGGDGGGGGGGAQKKWQPKAVGFASAVPLLPFEAEQKKAQAEAQRQQPKEYKTAKEKLAFSKAPREIEFKPKTLKEYQRPTEYVEIPNIQPDLQTDELVAKRANRDRIKEFSKNLKQFNTENLRQQPRLPSASEKNDMTIAAKKMESGRQRAIEYGRNVPKPKVKSGSKGGDEGGGGVASNIGIELGDEYMEVARMQELEQKHAANKAQIEAMKRQMGL